MMIETPTEKPTCITDSYKPDIQIQKNLTEEDDALKELDSQKEAKKENETMKQEIATLKTKNEELSEMTFHFKNSLNDALNLIKDLKEQVEFLAKKDEIHSIDLDDPKVQELIEGTDCNLGKIVEILMEKYGTHLRININNTDHNYWVENLVIPPHAHIVISAPHNPKKFDAKVEIRMKKQELIPYEGKECKRCDSFLLQRGCTLQFEGVRLVQDFEKQKEKIHQSSNHQGTFPLSGDFVTLSFTDCIVEQREDNFVVFCGRSSFCPLHMCHCKIINMNPNIHTDPVNLFEFALGCNSGRPNAKVDLHNVHLTKGVRVCGDEAKKFPNELILSIRDPHENEDL